MAISRRFFEPRLSSETAALAANHDVVSAFVHDRLDALVLSQLASLGVRLIVLRCAGFNNVDVPTATAHGITVARVPAYSPHAVAEHTVGLMLTLNRKFHRAFARVRDGNFALEGLLGFDMRGKTAGVVGTGRIGEAVVSILRGFGCRILAYDPRPSPACEALGADYVAFPQLLQSCDLITLHCPLTPETHHLIDATAFESMKPGVMLINTSRGGLLDTSAAITALKAGHLGALGLDVYEEEADLFFENLSEQVLQDDVLARLLTFPNVIVTAHQGFFTREAVQHIAHTTAQNCTDYAARALPIQNLVTPARIR